MQGEVALRVLLLAACIVIATAALSSTDKSSILANQNKLRDEVPHRDAPLPTLVWSDALASSAQSHASLCLSVHSILHRATYLGEVILSGNTSLPDKLYALHTGQDANYDFYAKACDLDFPSCNNWLQIVQENVTSVGCALNTCSFGSLLVCQYGKHAHPGVLPYKHNLPPFNESQLWTNNDPNDVWVDPEVTLAQLSKRDVHADARDLDFRKSRCTVIKNQGSCGGCWSFATAAIIEGAQMGKYKTSASLSEQQLIDCGSGSCAKGGWPATAITEAQSKQAGRIDKLANYKYITKDSTCKFSASVVGATISATGIVPKDNASILKYLKAYGPLAVSVNASAWMKYKSGILKGTAKAINHAVTLVGYNAEKNIWIIRNSWGTSWGMGGYAYVQTNSNFGMNLWNSQWVQVA